MNRGYRIPTEGAITEELYCLKVYIPRHTDYLIQFFTALSYFGKWKAWHRLHDGMNTEKQVADMWKVANELTHTAWAESECDMPPFRINPDTCLLEVQCGEEWQPVITTAFDPSTQSPVTPPYPDEPAEGQSNECIASTNLVQMLQTSAGQFSALISTGGFIGQVVALLFEIFNSVVTVTLETVWGVVRAQYDGFDGETFPDDLAAFDWDSLKDYLQCRLLSDGRISGEEWAIAFDYFGSRFATTGNQVWYYLEMVWGVMGTVGVAYAGLWAGITEGDCVPCGGWEIDHDFSTGTHGWEIRDNQYDPNPDCESGTQGSYQTGYGFRTEYEPYNGSPASAYQVMIRFALGDAVCENVNVYWDSGRHVDYVRVGGGSCSISYSQPDPAGTDHHFDVDIHDGYLYVALLGSSDQPSIVRVIASGTGALP